MPFHPIKSKRQRTIAGCVMTSLVLSSKRQMKVCDIHRTLDVLVCIIHVSLYKIGCYWKWYASLGFPFEKLVAVAFKKYTYTECSRHVTTQLLYKHHVTILLYIATASQSIADINKTGILVQIATYWMPKWCLHIKCVPFLKSWTMNNMHHTLRFLKHLGVRCLFN